MGDVWDAPVRIAHSLLDGVIEVKALDALHLAVCAGDSPGNIR
jgi:hypothetical protein